MSRPSPLKSLRPLRPHNKLEALAARTNRRPQACGLIVRDHQTLEFLNNSLRQDFTTKDFVHKVFKKLRPLLEEQQMDRTLMKRCRSNLISILQGQSGQLDLQQVDRLTWQHGLLGLILGSLRQLNQSQPGVPEVLLKSKQDHLKEMIWQSAKQKQFQIKQRLESMSLDPQQLISTLKARKAELSASEKAVRGLQQRVRWLQEQRVREYLDLA